MADLPPPTVPLGPVPTTYAVGRALLDDGTTQVFAFFDTASGRYVIHLPPDSARDLATRLIGEADQSDGKPVKKHLYLASRYDQPRMPNGLGWS